jgi:hypothetical protein
MAQSPEGKVKDFIRKYMTENFEDIWYFSPPGGMFGNGGVPDHLYLWKGIFIAIEAKVEGNTPSVLQWRHLRHIARQGGVAAVVTGKDLDKMVKIRNKIFERINYDSTTTT